MRDVAGKVAVITGGASGIGLGMARAFAGEGMKLALADIDEERLSNTVRSLRSAGVTVVGMPTDVADRASVDGLASAAVEQYGAVHLLCNNAGGPLPRSVAEVTRGDFDRVLGVNLYGVIHGIQAFLPIMESQGEGHINATSSMSGLLAFPPVVTYSVAKFGVIALMETLARELRDSGSDIEVSVLCPAETATDVVQNSMANARMSGYEPSPDELTYVEAAHAGLTGAGMDPDEVGRIAFEGIRDARFWIFSHPHLIEGPIRERFEAMAADGNLPDF
ncbi:MAG: SDR family NAD(P)-dependent oxidoreductase [Acidimicrobiia bacterium]